jgi:hypothetical protein
LCHGKALCNSLGRQRASACLSLLWSSEVKSYEGQGSFLWVRAVTHLSRPSGPQTE